MGKKEMFYEVNKLLGQIVLTSDGEDRFRALGAICGLRDRGKDCIPELIESLRNTSHINQKCYAIGMIGSDAIIAENNLINLFYERPPDLDIEYVLQALGRIGSVKAAPIYLKALESASNATVDSLDAILMRVFSRLREKLSFLIPDLREMLKSRKFKRKDSIIGCLVSLHDPVGIEHLREMYVKAKDSEDYDHILFLLSGAEQAEGEFRKALELFGKSVRRKSTKHAILRILSVQP